MSERERREESTSESNGRDEIDEASDRKEEDASVGAVEEEEETGGPGRAKDNVRNE